MIGYNASNRKTGTGTSAPFSIEVVRLNSPNGGETFQSGQNFDIRWSTHGTKRPVNSIRLAYTKDGGITWNSIDKVPADPESFGWRVPSVREPKTMCKVKISLLDEKGLVVGSDISNGYFTIQPAP